MSPTELRDPVYLRAWCIDQATMVSGRENVSAEAVLNFARRLEHSMRDIITQFPLPISES